MQVTNELREKEERRAKAKEEQERTGGGETEDETMTTTKEKERENEKHLRFDDGAADSNDKDTHQQGKRGVRQRQQHRRKRLELLRLNTDLVKYAQKFRRCEFRPLRETFMLEELASNSPYACSASPQPPGE